MDDAPSFEELRSAYIAKVFGLSVRRVLVAMKAWNAMPDSDKHKVRVPAEIKDWAA